MRAYAALDDRLLVVQGRREDDGITVETVEERLAGHQPRCVSSSQDASDRVFVGTRQAGLHRSTDSGSTFARIDTFESAFVTAVAVSPHDPATVWAGTEPSAVYRSADAGDSWEDHTADAQRDNHTLATHPDAPGRVYAAAGDGYAESTDGGETWEFPQVGPTHRYVWGLAVDSGDPETVVVSAASSARTAHRPERAESYVFRRDGVREAWELAMEGLPEPDGTVSGGARCGNVGRVFRTDEPRAVPQCGRCTLLDPSRRVGRLGRPRTGCHVTPVVNDGARVAGAGA